MNVDAFVNIKMLALCNIEPEISGVLSPTLFLCEVSRNTPIHDVWISDADERNTINGHGQKTEWSVENRQQIWGTAICRQADINYNFFTSMA